MSDCKRFPDYDACKLHHGIKLNVDRPGQKECGMSSLTLIKSPAEHGQSQLRVVLSSLCISFTTSK